MLKVPFQQEGNLLVPQAARNGQERSGLAVDLNEPTFCDYAELTAAYLTVNL
jgi:hypothetical protein